MSKEEIKKELEKQLQLLSKLSEHKGLDTKSRLDIASKIVDICNALVFFC